MFGNLSLSIPYQFSLFSVSLSPSLPATLTLPLSFSRSFLFCPSPWLSLSYPVSPSLSVSLPLSLSLSLLPCLPSPWYGEQMFSFLVPAGCCNDRFPPHVLCVVYRGFTPLFPDLPWGNVLTRVIPKKIKTGSERLLGGIWPPDLMAFLRSSPDVNSSSWGDARVSICPM